MAVLPVLADLDLTRHEIQNAKAQQLAADPGSPAEGLYYWHTGNKEWRVYNGTAWIALGAGTITGVSDTAELDLTVTAGVISGVLINGSVALARLANIGAHTYLGNNTGAGAAPVALTRAQLLTDLAIDASAGDVLNFDTRVRTSRLDQMAAPTADVSLNSHRITNLLDGVAVTDGITLGQLQAAIEGRQWKDPVATATSGVLPNTPTYNAGAGTLSAATNTTLAAQSGHTLLLNERILVKDQASTFQNGLYALTQVGSGAAPWILTRVADASTAAELSNATTTVEANDSTLKGKTYTQQNTLADLTAAAQSYTITGDNNTYTADGSTLQLVANQFSVLNNGIDNTKLTDMVQATFKMRAAGAGTGDPIDGTVAQAKAALAYASTDLSDTATLTRKFSQDYGNGVLLDVPITHNLGTTDVEVVVRRNSDGLAVWVPWIPTSANVVTLKHDAPAPTTAQYRVTVQA